MAIAEAGSVSNTRSDLHLKGGSYFSDSKGKTHLPWSLQNVSEEKSKAECASCLLSGHLRF